MPRTKAKVLIADDENAVQLTIRDDGPGFDLTKVRLGGGLGILNMNERARLVNGTLLLNSHSGDGTVIAVRLPVVAPH